MTRAGDAAQVVQNVEGAGHIFSATGDVYVVRTDPVAAADQAALRALRERVESIWIRGVLQTSLHGQVLQLSSRPSPDEVEPPWGRSLERAAGDTRQLERHTPILEVFDTSQRTLLILGEPGSGKTMTLLELASALIEDAKADPAKPVPVVLNLATWGQKREPIQDWFGRELAQKYGVPRRQARAWLDRGALFLLLDGLDEVAAVHRGACVAAINELLVAVGVPGICVCSRVQDYVALPVKLRFSAAIRIEPLTDAEVTGYLARAGNSVAGLSATIAADEVLREAARSPLMLSIMTLAYAGAPSSAPAAAAPVLSPGDRRQAIFTAYVAAMFHRRGGRNARYGEPATRAWLGFIARGMRDHSLSQFFLEGIQPDWLPGGVPRLFYLAISRWATVTALIAALQLSGLGRALSSEQPWYLVHGMSVLAVVLDVARSWHIPRVWRIVAYAGVGALVASSVTDSSFGSAITGASILGMCGAHVRGTWHQEIQTVERLVWSWTGVWRRTRRVVTFVGLPCVLLIVLSAWLDDFLWIMVAILAVAILVVAVVIAVVTGGLTYRSLPRTLVGRPNQGMVLSLFSALLIFTITVAAVTTLALVFTGDDATYAETAYAGVLTGVGLGAYAAVIYGGLDLIQHVVLRILLCVTRKTPYRYARFLDHAVALAFFQKIGGGYIFVHRMLLDHFAEQHSDH